MGKTLLVIGAHSADFVWRAAGTIAVVTSQGGSATVVALSYGERGESGELWKEPGQTVENVKRIRHEEAERGGAAVGANFRCLDLGDYPLTITDADMEQLVELFRELQPQIVLTHTPADPFNPDHPVASQAVQRARLLAAGAGVASAFKRIIPPDLYFFEPHQPELCEFIPNTFVDITPVHGAEGEGDGGHAGAGLPADLLHRARRAARQPRPPDLRDGRRQVRRGVAAHAALGGEEPMTEDQLARLANWAWRRSTRLPGERA